MGGVPETECQNDRPPGQQARVAVEDVIVLVGDSMETIPSWPILMAPR